MDRELAVAEVRQVHQKATVAAGYIGETSCDDRFAEPSDGVVFSGGSFSFGVFNERLSVLQGGAGGQDRRCTVLGSGGQAGKR